MDIKDKIRKIKYSRLSEVEQMMIFLTDKRKKDKIEQDKKRKETLHKIFIDGYKG